MSHTHSRAHPVHADGKLSSIRDEVAGLQESLNSSIHEVTTHGKRTALAAGAAAKEAAAGLRDTAMQTRDRVGKTISDRPFTSVAIAAAAGAALMGMAMMWRRRG